MSSPVAVLPFWKDYDRKLYLRAAILADELGYDSFWIPEAWGYEVFSLLTEIALNTRRIKLGTGIVNVFSRSEGLLAMTAATVDEISEGRLILGIGTSGMRVIEGFHGRCFDKPLTQVRDTIRVVKVTRTLLAGGKLTESGRQAGGVPALRAGDEAGAARRCPSTWRRSRRRASRSIGEVADGWMPTFWPYQELKSGHEWIARGRGEGGARSGDIVTAPFTTALPMGMETAASRRGARQIVSFYIGGMGEYYIELLTDFGFGDDCQRIAALYRNRQTRAEAAAAVPDALLEALAITGDPAECVTELERRRQFGIDLPILNLPTKAPWEIVEGFIRAMAPR
jgi:alkanesulfonate monooxygenase SsuD/methylene tetrahydromethanopterin reductase-like flavin-dependent oxidoreductase (luciferase family)